VVGGWRGGGMRVDFEMGSVEGWEGKQHTVTAGKTVVLVTVLVGVGKFKQEQADTIADVAYVLRALGQETGLAGVLAEAHPVLEDCPLLWWTLEAGLGVQVDTVHGYLVTVLVKVTSTIYVVVV
jgi:hypothetical protein